MVLEGFGAIFKLQTKFIFVRGQKRKKYLLDSFKINGLKASMPKIPLKFIYSGGKSKKLILTKSFGTR